MRRVSKCCAGCSWHISEIRKVRILEDADLEDTFGCTNPFIASEWCLNLHRPDIKGIYFQSVSVTPDSQKLVKNGVFGDKLEKSQEAVSGDGE